MYPCCLPNVRWLRLSVCVSILAYTLTNSEEAKAASSFDISSIDWYGDVRLRVEQDWDSQTSSGAARSDRLRGRYRFRLGAKVSFDDDWTGGVRWRTGNSRSQQSPHLTFDSDSGGSDEFDGMLDKYFVQFADGDRSVWIGRNSLPFWKQNEFFWDDDVTPTGVAGTFTNSNGSGKFVTSIGAFTLPDGGWGLNGTMVSGQIRYTKTIEEDGTEMTLAFGLHRLEGESGAEELISNNGMRDYFLANLGAQWAGKLGNRNAVLGMDLFKNLESYTLDELDPFLQAHADEDFGYVLSFQLGQTKEPGDWQFGYYYAHIETFAVNASYAQDDWVRFGSATQTAGSDCKGHEFRLSYSIAPKVNVVARLFDVDSITSIQDGKRFRLDLNWKF